MKPVATPVVTTAIALGIAGTGLLAAGCGTLARAHTVSTVTVTITIDPAIGETFAPAPAGAEPALTAQQAWAKYTHVDRSYRNPAIPSDVTTHLGLLTLPYTAHNELVYGYSWHSCPASRNPRVKKLPSNPCIEWNFLNASTGQQIDETWMH